MQIQNKAQSKNENYRSYLPYGFDYYDETFIAKRLEVEGKLRKCFASHTFIEVGLPALDYASTFELANTYNQGDYNFSFKGREGERLSLRSDLSVLLAKAVANGNLRGDSKKENTRSTQKYSYIQNVFQDYPWGSGHKREIWQAGAEIFSFSPTPPLERTKSLLDLSLYILDDINHKFRKNIKILYGDLRVISHLYERVPQEFHFEMSQAIHQKKISQIQILCNEANLDDNIKEVLIELPLLFGDVSVLDELIRLTSKFPALSKIFIESKSLSKSPSLEGLIFDFSLVHELAYYTSSVFEAYHPLSHQKIFSGGVYDHLYKEFTNSISYPQECGAAGFALNLSVLLALL